VDKLSVNQQGGTIAIRALKVVEDTSIGDSIAINGVCLTIRELSDDHFEMDVMPETIRCTNIALLKRGSKVNMERAVSYDSRLGGHVLTGHIDAIGIVRSRYTEGRAVWIGIESNHTSNVVPKGPIAIDGVSLTVSKLMKGLIWVSLIPQTLDITTLSDLRIGDRCNIEYDIFSKYAMADEGEKLTMNKLIESGF